MTHAKLSIALLLLLLSACASSPDYANFLPRATAGQDTLAKDVVDMMRTVLPPAKTALRDIPATDPFGAALLTMLRTSGYALVDSDPGNPSARSALPIRYVVDKKNDANFYLVRVNVGPITLSRPYTLEATGVFRAVGGWVMSDASISQDSGTTS